MKQKLNYALSSDVPNSVSEIRKWVNGLIGQKRILIDDGYIEYEITTLVSISLVPFSKNFATAIILVTLENPILIPDEQQ